MPGYLTKQESVAVTGVAALQIRSLLDRNQFADPQGVALGLGISSAAWPIFGLLWPSGYQLAMRIAARPVRDGERILEMGCGLALTSLVAHRRGADITASDHHPLAESFLRENERLNDLPALSFRHGDWSDPSDSPHCFDLLVGSDLLYERSAGPLLAAFIDQMASACAEVWIIDPDRGNRPAFNRSMNALGFERTEERLDCIATDDAAAYKGRLLSFRRSDAGRGTG
jgi:predicted nicotinamide N-methyase